MKTPLHFRSDPQRQVTAGCAVTCRCGSLGCMNPFQQANLHLTLAGRIVLSSGCGTRSDQDVAVGPLDTITIAFLPLFTMDRARDILVLTVEHEIGAPTHPQIDGSPMQGQHIPWLELQGEEMCL